MEAIAVPPSAPTLRDAPDLRPARRSLFARLLDDSRSLRRVLLAGLAAIGLSCAPLTHAQQPFPQSRGPAAQPVENVPPVQRQRLLAEPLNHINPASAVQRVGPSKSELLEQPLADVRIEGNTTILEYAIMQRVHARPGRTVSLRSINDDVQAILNTRWFLHARYDVQPSDAGPVLIFHVVERPIITEVRFEGCKKIKASELQAHTGLTVGGAFDVSANLESVQRIKSLYLQRGHRFAEVTLVSGGKPNDRAIVFNIVEGPHVRVWGVHFEGNEFETDGVLRTKVDSKLVMLWIIGGDYDPDVVRNDTLVLKQYFMSLGFFDVDVSAAEAFSEDKSKVYITFHINEGRRYKVGKIDVVGNDVISREALLEELELASGDFFNERFLRKDVTKMTDQYDELGRIFAEVKPTPHFREDGEGWVDLTYQINEDVPRYIGRINVKILGDYPHTRSDLVLHQVNRFLKPGMLASSQDLRMAQQRVAGSAIWDQTKPPAFNIVPTDGQNYFPSTLVRGQSDDRLKMIEETLQRPGVDPAELFGVEPAQFHPEEAARIAVPDTALPAAPLRKLRAPAPPVIVAPMSDVESMDQAVDAFFRGQSPEDIQFRPQSIDAYGQQVPQDYMQGVSPQGDPFGDALSAPPPGFVDINIDVNEGRTGRLMFGVGVNSDAGVVGSLVLQEDNFDIMRPPTSFADIINGTAWRGAGQSFRLEAVPGTQVSRYMASWQDPFFLGTDYSLGLSGFYYNRFFRRWTEDRLGGRVSVGYVLNRYWSVNGAVRLENVHMGDFPTVGAPADLEAVRGDNFLSTGSITLAYDTRDNSFLPTQGHNLNLTYEQGFGEFNYPRFDVAGGQYFTTYERPDGNGKHILATSGQFGWTGDDTPIFERYYAGGYSSFRGFAFRGVTPIENGYEVGGDFMAIGTVEYMVPITADDNFRVVVFSDFGTVEPDLSLDQFRASAGFGFRVSLPALGQAPLAFDFAWPILKEDFDRLRVFSFYVGFVR